MEQKVVTLGEALPKEIARCRKLVEIYKEIPTGGFGAAVIQQDIDAAEAAQASGDTVGMLRSYHKLKKYKS
jgi:hypothetical protein